MAFFRKVIDGFGTFRHGDPEYLSQQFLKTSGIDRVAVRELLGAMEDTDPAALAAITMPTLVLCGDQDNDNGSADKLAQALPDARRATIPARTWAVSRGPSWARNWFHSSPLRLDLRAFGRHPMGPWPGGKPARVPRECPFHENPRFHHGAGGGRAGRAGCRRCASRPRHRSHRHPG
jgi:hypothetical protein